MKARVDELYDKTIALLKEDIKPANWAQLSKLHADNLLSTGDRDQNAAETNKLYDRWMRVFHFGSDNFWCQCCRYSPNRYSKKKMNEQVGVEPRFYCDLASKELAKNKIPLDKTALGYLYLELPTQDLTEEERGNNKAVFVKYHFVKFKKHIEARYSREHRMIYIPCEIANPGNNVQHPKQPLSQRNGTKGFVWVPLPALLLQRITRAKLINLLFHSKTRVPLALSILGHYDLINRDILSQMAPAAPVREFVEEARERVVLDRGAVKGSKFLHCRTPSWQRFDHVFPETLVAGSGTGTVQMLDFDEYDVKSHGAFGVIAKYSYQRAKYTGIYEWLQAYNQSSRLTGE